MPNPPVALLFVPWLLALVACSSPSADPTLPTGVAAAGRAARALDAGPAPEAAEPRDAYVLLSGGGTPLSNNYSQYVQAKAIAEHWQRTCPPERTWVFFGAGNREGEPPVLADVRRETVRDGLTVHTWLPGALRNNRPATRASFVRALREEILPVVRGGGTLFLFVGDHGELTGEGDKAESAIVLWQLKRGPRRRAPSWITDPKEILGVAELRELLAAGLGRGRVVFCMTQCHGGGFHELGVARAMTPPRDWYAVPPAVAPASATGLRLPVAGFTATDEQSPAAGCVANPDPDHWAGYERYLPESWLGIDLLTGAPKGRPLGSFAAAHEAATLVDETIDQPRSTSEHFLLAWAEVIENQLARPPAIRPAVADALVAYSGTLDTGRVPGAGGELGARQAQYQRYNDALAIQAPGVAELLRTGSRRQLEAVRAAPERARAGPRGRRGSLVELRRAWTETLRPAWKEAVHGGRVAGLAGPALAFERHLLAQEDAGRNLLLARPGGEPPWLNEVYWYAGYGEPARFDPAAAAEISRWAAERRRRIVGWAQGAADAAVRDAAAKIGSGAAPEPAVAERMTRETAAARVLMHRRVLAAWEFLQRLDARPALEELQTLLELERSPLPAGLSRARDE